MPAAIFDSTSGRGADSVIEAVGMEAHGTPFQGARSKAAGMLPDPLARKATETVGVDRMAALRTAFNAVRRGGTISIIGVYGGEADPFPMMDLFDKGVTMRMGQAHVKRWIDDIMPLLDRRRRPAGRGRPGHPPVPLDEAPHGVRDLQEQGRRLHQGRPQAGRIRPQLRGMVGPRRRGSTVLHLATSGEFGETQEPSQATAADVAGAAMLHASSGTRVRGEPVAGRLGAGHLGDLRLREPQRGPTSSTSRPYIDRFSPAPCLPPRQPQPARGR